MNIFYILLFFLFNTSPPIDAHEFHLSKSTINYSTEEQSLQITMNMFIDDLELALKPTAGDTLRICTRKEQSDAEDFMYDYIKEHLVIKVNGQVVNPIFLGKEPSDDLAAVWCYLEVENILSFRDVSITNTIMTELFDDQKNMTNIKLDKERVEDILFTSEKTSENISLK